MTEEAGFKYTVQKGEFLTKIFQNKAKEDGLSGEIQEEKWQDVMSVFDEIQAEKQKNGESLYRGGNKKRHANWHKNYVIDNGQEISVTDSQLKKIYDAMGLKKAPEQDTKKATAQGGSDAASPHTDKQPSATEDPQAATHQAKEAKKEDLHIVKKEGETVQFESGNVKGKYTITADEKNGYNLETADLKIKGDPEAEKYFSGPPKSSPGRQEEIRGIRAPHGVVGLKADEVAKSLSINNAVYKDIVAKDKSGAAPTEPEQKFMEAHKTALKKYGLALNEKDEIIDEKDAPKEVAKNAGEVKQNVPSLLSTTAKKAETKKVNTDGTETITVQGSTTEVHVPGSVVAELSLVPGTDSVYHDIKTGKYYNVSQNKITELNEEQLKALNVEPEAEAEPKPKIQTKKDSGPGFSAVEKTPDFKYRIMPGKDATQQYALEYTTGNYSHDTQDLYVQLKKRITPNEDNSEWTLSGIDGMSTIKSKSPEVVKLALTNMSKKLDEHRVIYADLKQKSNSGQALSEYERDFMNRFLSDLETHGLTLDENSQIIEKQKN